MKSPELWKFDNYTQIQVQKDKAVQAFGPTLGQMLAEGQAVVLIPVDCIDDYIDTTAEVVEEEEGGCDCGEPQDNG
jgi:hypothetical protein